jgi:hypothetical protein
MICNMCVIPVPLCQFCVIFVVLGSFFSAVVLLFIAFGASEACLPGPFLYITTHGRNNIYKFSRDGCMITTKVLKHEHLDATTFRSMTFGQYGDVANALFVASAEG